MAYVRMQVRDDEAILMDERSLQAKLVRGRAGALLACESAPCQCVVILVVHVSLRKNQTQGLSAAGSAVKDIGCSSYELWTRERLVSRSAPGDRYPRYDGIALMRWLCCGQNRLGCLQGTRAGGYSRRMCSDS
jgi:hypothetical protein